MPDRTMLLGTSNPGKVEELRQLLRGCGWRSVSPAELAIELSVVESGTAYSENSALKAIAYSRASDLPVLADDSGLEVDALNGAPGIASARMPGGSDRGRTDWLLAQLLGVPSKRRGARFVCVATVARRGIVLAVGCGQVRGQIALVAAGAGGFGYDPVFLPDGCSVTLAELGPDIKNQISHRRQAVAEVLKILGDKT